MIEIRKSGERISLNDPPILEGHIGTPGHTHYEFDRELL